MSASVPSVASVVSDLGGVAEVARLLGCRDTAVHNMVRRGAFPAHSYFRIRDALLSKSRPVPEELWRRGEFAVQQSEAVAQ